MSLGAAAISRAVRRLDYFRRAPQVGRKREHREWLHFCVRAPEVDVIVNFSLLDDPFPSPNADRERGYVMTLVHDGSWSGSMAAVASDVLDVRRGRIDAGFAGDRVEFAGDAFHIATRSAELDLAVNLVLSPLVLPAIAHNVPIPGGARTSWLALPRLSASGLVRVNGRVHTILGAPAYHDHNWGYEVGGDCSWQWGYLAPEDPVSPWSCVFVRIGDRLRAGTWMQGLFLWRGAEPCMGFRGRELAVREEGLLRQERIPKFPAPAALIVPGSCADVPRRLAVSGAANDDVLEYTFECVDIAQVVLPEANLQRTVINEVRGNARIEGVIGGERVMATGRSFAEFVEVRA